MPRTGSLLPPVQSRTAALDLFARNRPLAFYVAKGFRQSAQRHGIDHDDLTQACLCGLWRAAQLFRPDHGNQFSTYATWACRSHAIRLLDEAQRRQRLHLVCSADLPPPPDPDSPDLLTLLAVTTDDQADRARAAREELHPLLTALRPRLRQVLTLRFGLDGHGERTLEECAAVLGVTRERCRQLESVALAEAWEIHRRRKQAWQRKQIVSC